MKSPGLWLGGMVAVVALGFAALVNLGGAASGSTLQGEDGKTLVCHKPDGPNPEEKWLKGEELQSHLNHGDKLGPCNGGSESHSGSSGPPTSEPPTSAPPTTPGPTVTVLIPGPGATSVVTSTATITATPVATVTATAAITPAPATVSETPIPPAAGTVAQGQEVTPMPATVPAGGGSEGSSGLPMTALLLMVGSVLAAIGASVKLARGNR